MSDQLSVIILAAGKGTRMKSPLPKVLHPVAGIPMIVKVISAVKKMGAEDIRLVVGHGASLVESQVEALGVSCFQQKEQKGTAHAVQCAHIEDIEGDVLILNGDHPLLSKTDLQNFWREFREEKAEIAVVSTVLKNPASFGRIIRHHGEIQAIVEVKDASADTLKINEVNTGIYLVKAKVLQEILPLIKSENSKQEYYLTDLISMGLEKRKRVRVIKGSEAAAFGVNTQNELARATKFAFKRKAMELMDAGVVIIDPGTTYIEDSVQVGAGSVLYPNCFIKGNTTLGAFTVVEPNVFITDCEIQDSVRLRAGSYLESAKVASHCSVGPYARLRPETVMMTESHVGNFVELKKVTLGKKSKAGHLTYLGDAEIGEEVNIGCGTITCNYAVDKKKYQTKIGDRVFVGSDTQFVAPVTIGADAIIGSGSTITKDVPAKALAVARGRQIIKENYSKSETALPEADSHEKNTSRN